LATSHPVNGIKAIAETGQFHNCNIERVAICGWIAATDSSVERVFGRPATGRLTVSNSVKSAEKTAGRNTSGLECLHSILRGRRALISGSPCGTLDRVGVTKSVTDRVLRWHPCHDCASLRVRCRWWGWRPENHHPHRATEAATQGLVARVIAKTQKAVKPSQIFFSWIACWRLK
jgi:hypothetical protein